MDTGSHLLFGATLAGLALMDPVINSQPDLFHAILTATLVGSHAPDLDAVARLKSYSTYLRIHRGFTHSLPSLFLLPFLLTLIISSIFGEWEHAAYVFLWSMIAVIFHIFLDWCNVYGVQCFRPFSKGWHHMDVLTLFEPFLFGLHAAGIILWSFTKISPGPLFLGIYALTLVYIASRAFMHSMAIAAVKKGLGLKGVYHVMPGLHWFQWQIVVETYTHFYTGKLVGNRIVIKDEYAKTANPSLIQAAQSADGVRAFLHFAQRVHVCCREREDGYLVEWRDVRFWYNHKLPFGVDVQLDQNLNVVSCTLGWQKKAWHPPFV